MTTSVTKTALAATGGVVAAVVSTLCCVGPLVAVALGLSGAGSTRSNGPQGRAFRTLAAARDRLHRRLPRRPDLAHRPVDGGAHGGGHGVHRQRSPLWPSSLLLHRSLPSTWRRRDAHLRVGRLAAWARSLGLDRPRRGGGKLFPHLRPGVDLGEVRHAGSSRRRLSMLSSAKAGLVVVAGLTGAAFLCPLCGGGLQAARAQNLGITAQTPDTATVRLHISKMTCGSCPTTARLALQRLAGVGRP